MAKNIGFINIQSSFLLFQLNELIYLIYSFFPKDANGKSKK
jgi:hypothetical protein